MTIARGRCIGQAQCEVSLDPSELQQWTGSRKLNTRCDADAELSAEGIDPEVTPQRCGLSLNSSSLASCTIPDAELALMMIGRCFRTEIDLFGRQVTKQEIALFISLTDCVTVALLLLLINWLATRENEYGHAASALTAADFTIMLPHVPKHSSVQILDIALRYVTV